MIIRRTVTSFELDGKFFWRANVWTDKGHSSKTFLYPAEANSWLPASERKKK